MRFLKQLGTLFSAPVILSDRDDFLFRTTSTRVKGIPQVTRILLQDGYYHFDLEQGFLQETAFSCGLQRGSIHGRVG